MASYHIQQIYPLLAHPFLSLRPRVLTGRVSVQSRKPLPVCADEDGDVVKNLPAYLTPDRLRKHFEQQGAPSATITDVKISLKQDGTSRRFGFVCRCFVLQIYLQGVKDALAPRPHKRRRLEDIAANPGPSSRPHVDKANKNGKTSAPAPATSASPLDQFMDVMQPRTKNDPSWANDTKESYPVLPVVSPETMATSDGPDNIETVSDLEWMRQRLNLVSDSSLDKVSEQSDDEHQVGAIPEEHQDLTTKTIMHMSRLFLHLAFSCTEAEVMELFQAFVEIAQVHIPIDHLSKKSKGLAYVTFKCAVSAYETLDKTSFQGRLLHIIPAVDRKETKPYLESQGVILSTFSSRVRSDTMILVKNIPYGTTAEQIREMFELHGELIRVIVPPAAYRRLGSSVVYLEKGPMGMFQDTADAAGNSDCTLITAFKPITIAEQEAGSRADADEPALSAGTTLFVKNLAFSITAERLVQVFRGLSGFSFARVQTKPDPKRPTVPGAEASRLSMGYGFVGFKTAEDAKKAMKIRWARRGTEDEPKDNTLAKSRSTKMIVKNVPFEATKKDIRELFRSVQSTVYVPNIRFNPHLYDIVPMVVSNPFAFLEFLTRHEAQNAYAALRHAFTWETSCTSVG
ncbi:hypothetical protein F4604DRAFT_1960475 [Suillus subluteus]|nr:hypothetical protein F4604DRAFT_1960475 [Suillus subluteus]